MKVLVSTRATQGKRANDFCFCEDGELVVMPFVECSREKTDGRCGCRRSLDGVESGKATTTFTVEERNVTVDDLSKSVHAHYARNGWDKVIPESIVGVHVHNDVRHMREVAERYDPGDILERRGNIIQKREAQ